MTPGSYKSDKPINVTEIDGIQLNCDCLIGSIVNGSRESVLYSFALDKVPDQKVYKEPKINFFKVVNKTVLSRTTFYLEDDDYKPVDFSQETITFTCQLEKIQIFNLKRT